eukprot:UN0959
MDENAWMHPIDETADDDGIIPDKLRATNIYEDLAAQMRRVVPIWFVQVMLVALYIEQLNQDRRTKQVEHVKVAYWVVAVVFQIYAGEGQVGETFNPRYWNHVLATERVTDKMAKAVSPLVDKSEQEEEADREKINKSFQELGKCWSCFGMLRHEWKIRLFMDWSVNAMAKHIILYTVPIMVCVEKPLDFVKDLTAVMFITVLDDMTGEPKDAKELLVKLKFSMELSHRKGAPMLNLLEKQFVHEHPERFHRFNDLVRDKWQSFQSKGDSPPDAPPLLGAGTTSGIRQRDTGLPTETERLLRAWRTGERVVQT